MFGCGIQFAKIIAGGNFSQDNVAVLRHRKSGPIFAKIAKEFIRGNVTAWYEILCC